MREMCKFLGWCPLIQKYFFTVYDYAGKADQYGLLESNKKIGGSGAYFRDN